MYCRSSFGTSTAMRRSETTPSTIAAMTSKTTMNSIIISAPRCGRRLCGRVKSNVDGDDLANEQVSERLENADEHEHAQAHPGMKQWLHGIVLHVGQRQHQEQRQGADDPPLHLSLRGQ